MKAAFKQLENITPPANRLTSLERKNLIDILDKGRTAWIYFGGKNLNVMNKKPQLAKPKFAIKPKP